MPTPSPERATRHLETPPVPSAEIMKEILEQHTQGKLVACDASDYAAEYLNTTAGHSQLVSAAQELVKLLEQSGFTASLQYCRSGTLGHPLPVITAQSQQGDYLVANINMVWDPVIPFERGGAGEKSHIKSLIAPEDLEHSDNSLPHSGLEIESFAPNQPVSMLLYPSESADAPALAVPIFSAAAFEEALRHAAARVEPVIERKYSYIFDELIIPELRDRIRSETEHLGAREIPEIIDNGTRPDGKLFDLKAFAPKSYSVDMIRFECTAIYEKGAAILAGVSHELA